MPMKNKYIYTYCKNNKYACMCAFHVCYANTAMPYSSSLLPAYVTRPCLPYVYDRKRGGVETWKRQ